MNFQNGGSERAAARLFCGFGDRFFLWSGYLELIAAGVKVRDWRRLKIAPPAGFGPPTINKGFEYYGDHLLHLQNVHPGISRTVRNPRNLGSAVTSDGHVGNHTFDRAPGLADNLVAAQFERKW